MAKSHIQQEKSKLLAIPREISDSLEIIKKWMDKCGMTSFGMDDNEMSKKNKSRWGIIYFKKIK